MAASPLPIIIWSITLFHAVPYYIKFVNINCITFQNSGCSKNMVQVDGSEYCVTNENNDKTCCIMYTFHCSLLLGDTRYRPPGASYFRDTLYIQLQKKACNQIKNESLIFAKLRVKFAHCNSFCGLHFVHSYFYRNFSKL